MPKHICIQCIDKIEKACEIKQKCIDSDVILRQQLKNENVDIKVENVDENTILDSIKQEVAFIDYSIEIQEAEDEIYTEEPISYGHR